jgi:hypothetical protein
VDVVRTRWRPEPPSGHCIKAIRTDENGAEHVRFVGYIAGTRPSGKRLQVRAAGPEGLLENLPLPFEPPLIQLADEPVGYRYWWRQIVYVFDIDDPRLAPALPSPLPPEDLERVERFVSTSRDLAQSGVVSSVGGAKISIDDATGQESVVADFPRRDLQAGFTTFLRQCQGPKDEARFDAVYRQLERAAAGASDTRAKERLRQLDVWRGVVNAARKKSLNQLVRDRLVAEEDWKIWDYQEPVRPEEIVRRLNYGDLIHWGKTRDMIAKPSEDESEAAMQRTEFFNAALGLAHISIGFGEFARALITPVSQLWTP